MKTATGKTASQPRMNGRRIRRIRFSAKSRSPRLTHRRRAGHRGRPGLGGKIRDGASWEPGASELLLIGEPEKARAIIENWDGFHDQRSLFVSYAYGLLGDADKAAFWLQRAYEERDPQVVWAKVDPRLDGVRDNPRIQDIIRKIGL
jgi:hypothetical protein